MIWIIVNPKNCVVKLGVKNITLFVLIWLNFKRKVNIVNLMRAKTHITNAFPKVKLFNFFKVIINKKQRSFRNFKRVNLMRKPSIGVTITKRIGFTKLSREYKKAFEPVSDTTTKSSEDKTKTMMLTSKANNKALKKINNKLLEIMNDRGIIANYFMSPLPKITNPEHTSQFKLMKNPSSNRANELLKTKQFQLLFVTICWQSVLPMKNSN